MKQAVVIKGCMSNNVNGITVVLDRELPFTELLHAVADKFKESAKFLKNTKMAIDFEGRDLNSSEEQALLDTITDNSDISVLFVVDKDMKKQESYKQRLEIEELKSAKEVLLPKQEHDKEIKMFYKGTVRSGQEINSETSLIVMGDVNPGAKIISEGNIIVLGNLKGTACAGINGNKNAFVVALDMNPMQIRIADIIARCSDKDTNSNEHIPMIAYLEGDNIYIEPLNKEVLNDLQV